MFDGSRNPGFDHSRLSGPLVKQRRTRTGSGERGAGSREPKLGGRRFVSRRGMWRLQLQVGERARRPSSELVHAVYRLVSVPRTTVHDDLICLIMRMTASM